MRAVLALGAAVSAVLLVSCSSSKTPGSRDGSAMSDTTPAGTGGAVAGSGGVVSGTIEKGELDSYTFVANAGEGIQLRLVDVAGTEHDAWNSGQG